MTLAAAGRAYGASRCEGATYLAGFALEISHCGAAPRDHRIFTKRNRQTGRAANLADRREMGLVNDPVVDHSGAVPLKHKI
jgi:hypothetical protein